MEKVKNLKNLILRKREYLLETKQKQNHKSEKVPGTAENASVLSELVYESRSFRLNTRSFRVQCAHSFTRRHKESSVLHQISFCSPVPIRPFTIVCRIHSLRHLLQPQKTLTNHNQLSVVHAPPWSVVLKRVMKKKKKSVWTERSSPHGCHTLILYTYHHCLTAPTLLDPMLIKIRFFSFFYWHNAVSLHKI